MRKSGYRIFIKSNVGDIETEIQKWINVMNQGLNFKITSSDLDVDSEDKVITVSVFYEIDFE